MSVPERTGRPGRER